MFEQTGEGTGWFPEKIFFGSVKFDADILGEIPT